MGERLSCLVVQQELVARNEERSSTMRQIRNFGKTIGSKGQSLRRQGCFSSWARRSW